jgi:hypothetical protein
MPFSLIFSKEEKKTFFFSSSWLSVYKYSERIFAFLLLTGMLAYAALCVNLGSPRTIKIGSFQYVTNYNKASYYQYALGFSVGVGCGYPAKFYASQRDMASSGVTDFLEGKTQKFNCTNFNPDKISYEPVHLDYYFLKYLGLWWRLFGVSWRSANYYWLFIYSVTLLVLYSVYRFFINPIFAALSTILTGSIYLDQLLIGPRDYSGAPFFCAILLISLFIVCRQCSSQRLLLLTILSGVISGIGVGFKTDVMAMIPGFLLAISFSYTKIEVMGKKYVVLVCVSLLYMSIVIAFMRCLPPSYTVFHVIIEGWAQDFVEALNLTTKGLYSVIPYYSDVYTQFLVGKYGASYLHQNADLYYSDIYKNISEKYYFHLLRFFPADYFSMVLASIRKILAGNISWEAPGYLLEKPVSLVRSFIPLTTIFLVITRNLRVGLFALLFTLGSSAYTVLQYHPRHHFYLTSFFFYFYLLLLITLSMSIIRDFYRQLKYQKINVIETLNQLFPYYKYATRIAFFSVLAVSGLLIGLRFYQNQTMHSMIQAIGVVKKTKLEFSVKKFDSNYLIVPNLEDLNKDAYYLVTFKKSKEELNRHRIASCYTPEIDSKLQFPSWGNMNTILGIWTNYYAYDVSMEIENTKHTAFLVPITKTIGPSFWRGFVIPEEELTDLVSIESIDDLSQFPIEPFMIIPENWREKNYYLTSLW